MEYFLILISLLLLQLFYFRIANHYNIIDKPNERSSHTKITIRGGGIIFPISVVIGFFVYGFQYPYFSLAVVLMAIISFLDDIYTLPTKPRLAVHLVSVGLAIYELGIVEFHPLYILLTLILFIGWINVFNFMDGINGITALYSVVSLISFYWINNYLNFVDPELIIVIGLGIIVFAFFNVRKRAKTFAGDVGSTSMAVILAFLMLKLILHVGKWEYVLFFSIYGIDSVITIFQRLFKGENIFKAHRTHLYQYMANEMGINHVSVSIIYACLQLFINAIIVYILINNENESYWLVTIILISLSIFYIVAKRNILNKLGIRK